MGRDREPQMEVAEDGTRVWHLDGQLHREDGPAVERADGHHEWWVNGQLHRTDGPAVEYATGYREWYLAGQLHRTDGPAIECATGYREWFLNDREMPFSEWLGAVDRTEEERVALIMRWG